MSSRRSQPVMLLALVLLGAAAALRAEDWPSWRGPLRDGRSRETGLQAAWPARGPRPAWSAEGVGSGYSSVAVSRGLVYTLGRREQTVLVTALEVGTGKVRWTREIGTTTRNPCSTPTVDGNRVYALSPDGDLACLHAGTGAVLWQRSYLRDFGGRMMSGRGYGESPLVDGERLICTPGGAEAALAALNKQTGALLWKAAVPNPGPAGVDGAGFSSPVLSTGAGVRQYVQLLGRGLAGVRAEDGRFLWSYNGIANGTANIPTPVVQGDFVFSANGYNAGSVLLRLHRETEGAAEAVRAEEVYRLRGSEFQNHHGGVILLNGHIYGGHGSNNGLPTCLELATGKILWKERGPGVGSAAVTYADNRFYFRYQNGVTALLEATPSGMAVRGTLTIPGAGGDSWAHPVVANGRLYLREQDRLWVYDVRDPAGARPPARLSRTPARRPGRRAGEPALPVRIWTASRESGVTPPAHPFYRFALDAVRGGAAPTLHDVSLNHRHLDADGRVREEVWNRIRALPGPLFLSLGGSRVSDAGLRQVAALPMLRGLSLEFCRRLGDRALQGAARAPRLRVLVLTGTGVTSAGLRNLQGARSLAALDLEGCDGVTDAACEVLGELQGLQALVLKKTGFEPERITDVGVQHLAGLTRLEHLNLTGNRVTDAGVEALLGLTQLRELDLSLLPITDAGVARLAGLPALRDLRLLYAEGFAGPRVTEPGLAALGRFPSLRSLDLTGARIGDAATREIAAARQLQVLRLARTGVTEAGVRALREALPGCRITR